jgi:hypothetical protein
VKKGRLSVTQPLEVCVHSSLISLSPLLLLLQGVSQNHRSSINTVEPFLHQSLSRRGNFYLGHVPSIDCPIEFERETLATGSFRFGFSSITDRMRSSCRILSRYRSRCDHGCLVSYNGFQTYKKNLFRFVALSRPTPVSNFPSRSVFSFPVPSSDKPAVNDLPINETVTGRDRNDTDSSFPSTIISMPMRQPTTISFGRQQLPIRREKKLLEYEVTELLNSPIGSFQPSTWLQIEGLLTQLREKEDIYLAFQLLDRVVKEPDASTQSTSDFIFWVVHDWLLIYERQQAKYQRIPSGNGRKRNDKSLIENQNTSDQRPTLSPLMVWRKIESYQRIGIPLESPVYRKIIQGTLLINSRKPSHPSGPILAETILDNMMSQSERINPLLRPTASVFAEVTLSWVRAASYCPEVAANEAPRRAMQVLNRLRELYNSGWGPEFLPSKSCFYRVMIVHAHMGDGDTVETLLEDLYTLYLDHGENLDNLRPTIPFFSLVLYAWSRSREPGAAERAEAILDRIMEIEANKEIRNFNVSTRCFNITMICWSKLRTNKGAAKVQQLFDRMLRLSFRDENKRPNGSSYFILTTTWARHDPFKADRAYRMWIEEHEKGNCDMPRDSKLLLTLVTAWYRSSEPCKAVRCDGLIQEAIQCNTPDFQPTTAIFTMAISAWCKTKTIDGVLRAEELLLQMEKCKPKAAPAVSTYLAIIQGWVILGRIERAEEVLTDCFLQVENKDISSDEEEVGVYDYMAERTSKGPSEHGARRRQKRLKPTKTQALNCVLKSWRSRAHKDPEAASRAEQLLLSTHRFDVAPNAASFKYVLDAWRGYDKNFNGANVPRTAEVLTLLDRQAGLLEENKNLFLKLRQDWKLLSIR